MTVELIQPAGGVVRLHWRRQSGRLICVNTSKEMHYAGNMFGREASHGSVRAGR